MENNWQKGIEDLQKIGLTKAEKDHVLYKILNSPSVPVKSPWIFANFMFSRQYLAAFSFFIFVIGGSVVFASENSLPGNILYPIKINITEPARDFIKILPENKLEWQAEKATRRLDEAKILIDKNKLDDKKRGDVEVLFEKYTENFKKSSEKEIEKIDQKYEARLLDEKIMEEKGNDTNGNKDQVKFDTKKEALEKEIKELKEDSVKAKKDMEKRLEKLEKDKEKTLQRVKNLDSKKDK